MFIYCAVCCKLNIGNFHMISLRMHHKKTKDNPTKSTHGGKAHLTVIYAGTQRFIITSLIRWLQNVE